MVPAAPSVPVARVTGSTAAGPPMRRPRGRPPTLRVERALLRDGISLLASMDEVGRGAPAGPVYVGVVVVDRATPPAPSGVRDSKVLSPTARRALVPSVEAWAVDTALGAASAAEVDAFGVTGALGLAGRRALARLQHRPGLVLLDGAHDWLTRSTGDPEVDPEVDLHGDGTDELHGDRDGAPAPVVTRVRADRDCASVAAASILAKVARDAVMVGLARRFPGYAWEANKGYGTADHLDALRRLGPTAHHRVTWRLPGCG